VHEHPPLNVMAIETDGNQVTPGAAELIVTARLGSAQPNAGLGYELDSIAALVIGGTSLSGGRGSVAGRLLGCLIIGMLNNGLFLLEVSPFWQQVTSFRSQSHWIASA